MPLYEYRCEGCETQFEVVQPISAKPEDTVCPQCHAKKATRLLSSFASRIVGDHKPGFAEMKAYNMLNERMSKFAKLPPVIGKRSNPTPNITQPPGSKAGEGGSKKEG